jgi:hypothetical protein
VLNMAQTWHQLRPGERRTNCGGCHAHSQRATPFMFSRAARIDYPVWDLVNTTPLVTSKAHDESKRQWDTANETGLRTLKHGPVNVEYFRDIQPILKRSCAACHSGTEPAGNLNLAADDEQVQYSHEGKFPGTYYRLALDQGAKFGHKPVGWDSWGYPNASRYVRMFQSRRSVLVWKLYGQRLDGFDNDDHPSETKPGANTLTWKGKDVELSKFRSRQDLDYLPPQCPPPDAIKAGKVAPLSDEDRRTVVRWIDLGCPIDLDFGQAPGYGWMLDDNRPVLTVTTPSPGPNAALKRVLLGAHDYGTGLDVKSLRVTADFALDGVPAGENLAPKLRQTSQGVWELPLTTPINDLPRGTLVVSVRDRQGNTNRVERTFWIGEKTAAK